MNDITGVILAGGRSRRMGADKSSLEIEGETLFQRQLRIFREVFPAILIAGDRPDLALPDVPSIPDLHPGSALGGLHTGLVSAGTPFIFAAPCDMPFSDAGLIRFIVSKRDTEYDAVVPRTSAGMEPLFAVYSRTCQKAMEQLLVDGRFRILDLIEMINTCFVEEDVLPAGYQKALTNINTLEDLERARCLARESS
jgi:molybdopterin-guanine dinucleotide biosynthesis protein A